MAERAELWVLTKERALWNSEETVASVHCVCRSLSDAHKVMDAIKAANPGQPLKRHSNMMWTLGREQFGFFDTAPITFRAVKAKTRGALTKIIEQAYDNKTD